LVLAVVVLAGCDTVPPSIPAPTTAAATSCTAVAVGWAVSVDEVGGSGLARYRIYRDAALLTEVAATATSWDDAVSGPASHVYGVSAVDVAGNESAVSETGTVVVPSCVNDTTPPSKPKNLTVAAEGCSQVALAWGESTDQGGSGLAGYDVYRGGAWLMRVPTRTATDTTVQGGTTYSYFVRAVDGAGNQSSQSGSKTASVPSCGGQPPVADAGPNHATQTLTTIVFDGSGSEDTDGSIVEWSWDFGDGATASGMTVSHAYGHAGTYAARLTVVDDDGLASSDTATVTASNRAPAANAGPDRSAAVGIPVAFDGSASTDSDGQITSYAWTFGDGGTANGVTPSHAYTQAGTYSARLTVTDDMGATHSDTAQVTVGEAGELVWTRTFGGSTFVDGVTVNDIATAPDGSVVVTGVLSGTASFGSGNLTSAGGNDVFVAAWSADGQPRWARRYGSTGHDFGAGVSVADDGDVLVTGGFTGSVDFGVGVLTSAGSYDLFVLRLSSSGAHRWSRRGGGSGDDSGAAVAVDLAGDVTFAGTISGSAEVGGATLTSAGGRDIVLAHYAGATGAHLWSKRFGASGFDAPEDIVADADGSVVVTGVFNGNVNFGGGSLSASGSDVFLARYAASGAHLWSRDFGASGDDQVSGLALAPDGDLVLAGQFATSIDFGGGALTNAAAPDVYVARLGSQGTHVWSKRWGTSSNFALVTTGVAVDPDGAVVFSGGAIEAISFGGPTLPASGGYDPYVVKLDPAGAHLWSKRCGSSGYPYNYSAGVATDADANVITTGSFSGGIDFGAGLIQNANNLVNQSYDGFIVKRRP
jgi:PKD repeat protein